MAEFSVRKMHPVTERLADPHQNIEVKMTPSPHHSNSLVWAMTWEDALKLSTHLRRYLRDNDPELVEGNHEGHC